MSKVQLQGNVSGTGVFTIASPNSNTDRTLTLPDNTGTILTNAAQSIPKSALPAGTVLQVVNTNYRSSTATTSGTYVNTGLSLSITPTSASSKILVIVIQTLYGSATSGMSTYVQLLRDSTSIVEEGYCFYVGDNFERNGFNYLDSPATTSTITYKTQFRKSTGGGSNVWYSYGDGGGQTTSSMTLMEIAA